MKLPLASWNRIVDALNIASSAKRKEMEASKAINDDVNAKLFYIASENFAMLAEKIANSNFD